MNGFHKGALAMIIEKVVKMATQLVMLVLLARVLGPEEMGGLMYCLALASMFVFLNTLGLDTVLVKVFVERSHKSISFLKQALFARLGAALVCVFLINVAGLWLVDEDSRLLLLLVSLYHMFMPFTVYEWFFQARGRGDLSAMGLIFGHIAGFLFRLVCIYIGADITWLGFAYVFEVLMMSVAYAFIAKKHVLENTQPISLKRICNLIQVALPLIISGAIVLLYMKIDQLMLGSMVGNTEVGIYVAATRLSEAWYFLGLTLIAVYYPKLLEVLKVKGEASYQSEIVNMGRWLVWGGGLLALVVFFIADWLIDFLYGSDYSHSAAVLVVTIWAVPFVYLGAISTKMYITVLEPKTVLWRSLFGLVLNVLLNMLLISTYGASGAAVASLVAQIGSSYLFNAIVPKANVFRVQSKILFLNKT